MKQKTVRFYDNAPDDMSALNILNECRKYGCNSARELVIAAINKYAQGGNKDPLRICSKDMDELANKIATKIKNMNATIGKEVGLTGEPKNENGTDKSPSNTGSKACPLEILQSPSQAIIFL